MRTTFMYPFQFFCMILCVRRKEKKNCRSTTGRNIQRFCESINHLCYCGYYRIVVVGNRARLLTFNYISHVHSSSSFYISRRQIIIIANIFSFVNEPCAMLNVMMLNRYLINFSSLLTAITSPLYLI